MEENRYLRLMGLGEILDASVRLYRQNFLALVTAQLPYALINLAYLIYSVYYGGGSISLFNTFKAITQPTLVQEPSQPGFNLLASMAGFLFLGFTSLIVYPLTMAAATKIASDSALRTPSSVREAYGFALKNWLRFIFTYLFYTIALAVASVVFVILIAVVIAVLVYFIATGGSLAAALVGLIIGVVITLICAIVPILVWTRLTTTFPVAVNERNFMFGALGKSWGLVKGFTKKTFAIMLLISLIPFIVSYSPAFLEFLLGRSLVALMLTSTFIAGAVLAPLVFAAQVVVYFELKTRKEGLDLEKRVEKLTE